MCHRIEAYNAHIATYLSHLLKGKWKRYKLDDRYVLLPVPDNADDEYDRLIAGCMFDDMVMCNRMAMSVRAYQRNLPMKDFRL